MTCSLFPTPCFYGICAIGSSITGVTLPSRDAKRPKSMKVFSQLGMRLEQRAQHRNSLSARRRRIGNSKRLIRHAQVILVAAMFPPGSSQSSRSALLPSRE